MFSLELHCQLHEAEQLSAELWDWMPAAISERETDEATILLAGFTEDTHRDELLRHYADWQPEWRRDDTNWIQSTERAWPSRHVGERLGSCAPWNVIEASETTIPVVINPGMASGTGEHPCTQLALEALERVVKSTDRVADIGAGSGILAIAAAQLGASLSVAVETDCDAIGPALENIGLNPIAPILVCGSANCLRDKFATIVAANISGSVLLSIFDDLLRILAPSGCLILTGFEEGEAFRFQQLLNVGELTTRNGWACLVAQVR